MSSQPGNPEMFRLGKPVVLWWAWLAFAAVNLVDLAIQGSGHFAAVVAAVVVAVTGVVYACALRPRVVADEAGLTVLNPLRDYRVPWGTVQAVDVGDWVRVHCGPGPAAGTLAGGKTINSWALFAPPRTRLAAARRAQDPAVRFAAGRLPEEARHLMSLPAAQVIAIRLDDRARRERGRGAAGGPPTARWAWPSLAAMILPLLALVIVALA